MTKKVVIKVTMNGKAFAFYCFSPESCHAKALRLAAGFQGVQSVALKSDKDQIEVTGEVDAVSLTTLLRKKVGRAEIVSVAEVKKEDESKDKPDKKDIIWPYPRHEIVYVNDPYVAQSWCWPL